MEEDMMDMQVQPVMQPEQPMMQGTPAPQELPMELQQEMDQISEPDQEEAKQVLSCKLYKFYNKWYLRVPQSKKYKLF